MSFFTDGNQTDQTETNQNQEAHNQQDFLQKVVQEKGEQWQDPQTLAKGYVNAQEYIKQLEQQTQEMREDLGKKDYAEKLLKELQGTQAPNSGVSTEVSKQNTGDTTTENTTPTVSEQDLKGLIEETLTQREEENTSRQNLKATDDKLQELFGTEVEAEVSKRIGSLGMSKERAMQIAAESPTAFFKLIGEDVHKESNPVRQGTVNTEASLMNQASGKRNWKYYQDLRRENKKLYYSPKTQNQMLKDRQEQGERFYN